MEASQSQAAAPIGPVRRRGVSASGPHDLLLVTVALALIGCTASFQEVHHFRSTPAPGQAANYFRLKVKGKTWFSSARYLAGYYDHRAVDLFFNELKSSGAGGQPDSRALFKVDQTEPGTTTTIEPLSPGSDRGSFVMLFSSNASTVADAIGQFAENQVVADAVSNLTSRGLLRGDADASAEAETAERRLGSVVSELTQLFALVSDDSVEDAASTQRWALRILEALARAAGHRGYFPDLDSAEQWFRDNPGMEFGR